MTDQSTPENPDVTPTEAIELADQQPVPQGATSTESAATAPTEEPQQNAGRHTRTILEIVGVAAAVVLIAAAAAGGFAAGLAVGDDSPRGFDLEHMAEQWQGGDGYGRGEGSHGERGRGFDDGGMGRGDSDGQGFGQGFGKGRGHSGDEMGPGLDGGEDFGPGQRELPEPMQQG